MANLLTHHDRLHVHGILGLIALLHYVYRTCFILFFQEDSFAMSWQTAVLLAAHVILALLSFQFHLPANRQMSQPMIWKEFRLHSLIFASRHAIACYAGVWMSNFWWREPTITSIVLKVVLVLLTCYLAEQATIKLGSKDARTTNAMPYPEGTPVELEKAAKWFYAKSQFAATSFCAFTQPSMTFIAMLGIQLAAFLMTLVRKGIIKPRTYHIVYGFSLFINFPVILAVLYGGDAYGMKATYRALIACFISCTLRLELGYDKYFTWVCAVVGGFVAGVLTPYSCMTPFMIVGMSWSFLDTVSRVAQASQMSLAKGVEGNFADVPGLTFSWWSNRLQLMIKTKKNFEKVIQ